MGQLEEEYQLDIGQLDMPYRLPTTINFIGFTESTKDFTLQKPGVSHFF